MKLRVFIAAALLLTAASSAHAQRGDAVVEGAGYELGEGTVFHPRASLRTGVISNVFYEDTNPSLSPVIRLLASLAIASEHNRPDGLVEPLDDGMEAGELGEGAPEPAPAPSLDFRFGGSVDYTQYISNNFNIQEQNGLASLGLGLDGHVVVLPQGPFSIMLDDSFIRDTRPRNFESAGNLARDINRLNAGLRIRPGAGALQFEAGYQNTLDRFESEASAFANRLNHLLRARAAWQFLPITRFYVDTSFGFFGGLGAGAMKPASTPLRIQLGAASAITESTTVRAHAGFGKGFYQEGEDFTGAIFGGEFGLRYSPTGRFTVAYQYDWHDSFQANFYRDHAVVANLDQQIQQIIIGIRGEARLRGYRGILPNIGSPTRDDVIFRVEGKLHYLLRDWLAFVGEIELITDRTDYRDINGEDPSYNRFELYAGATAAF